MKKLVTVKTIRGLSRKSDFTFGTELNIFKEEGFSFGYRMRAELGNVGLVGYVVDDTSDFSKGCLSFEKAYDKLGNLSKAKIVGISGDKIICEIVKKNVKEKSNKTIFVSGIFDYDYDNYGLKPFLGKSKLTLVSALALGEKYQEYPMYLLSDKYGVVGHIDDPDKYAKTYSTISSKEVSEILNRNLSLVFENIVGTGCILRVKREEPQVKTLEKYFCMEDVSPNLEKEFFSKGMRMVLHQNHSFEEMNLYHTVHGYVGTVAPNPFFEHCMTDEMLYDYIAEREMVEITHVSPEGIICKVLDFDKLSDDDQFILIYDMNLGDKQTEIIRDARIAEERKSMKFIDKFISENNIKISFDNDYKPEDELENEDFDEETDYEFERNHTDDEDFDDEEEFENEEDFEDETFDEDEETDYEFERNHTDDEDFDDEEEFEDEEDFGDDIIYVDGAAAVELFRKFFEYQTCLFSMKR